MATSAMHAPENYARQGRLLWRALVFLAVAGFGLLSFIVWSAYRETRAEAEATASNYAELVEARFDAALRRIDADLALLSNRVPEQFPVSANSREARRGLAGYLESHRLQFPEVGSFRIVDAGGNLLGVDPPVSIADRDYFAELRDGREARTVFSDRLFSRLDGQEVIVAARAMRAPDGRFLGAVIVPLDLEHFAHLFDSVRLGAGGALDIRRSDNHRLVLHAPAAAGDRHRPPEAGHPLPARLAAEPMAGIVECVSPVDGVERIYAYRALRNYPFYVLAGLSSSEVRAAWGRRVAALLSVGLLLFGALAVVLFLMFRAQQRESRVLAGMRRSKEQLKAAHRIARLGSWELVLATWSITGSRELLDIFEVDPQHQAYRYEDFLALVHPDDRAPLDATIRDTIERRGRFQLRHRLQMADGRIKHILVSGELLCAADGAPLSILGTAQDVTSQQQMEARLQLLASAFEYSGEAILITDRANNIVTVNPAFTKLTGYSAEESIGRNPRFLSAGRTTAEEYCEMWTTIVEQGFWQGEIWDRRKDGEIYPKWMSISLIRDNEGAINYHIAHFTDVSAERAAEAQLQHMAHHDVLTGLLNRFSLRGRLDQALAAARRSGTRVALLFIDLDRFKVINDTLGHHIGDKLLIEVAARLRDSVRDSDVVARLGGDEFVVMLSGMLGTGAVTTIAEKLIRNIGDSCRIEGHDLYTTPSIGIAIFPDDGENGDALMKNADAAMYHAKAAGRNNFQFFDARMNDAALERLRIEHSLRQALAREEFCLHYQPIIEVASGRVYGIEALVRWQHPEMGMVPPASFIAIAEETGLIQPIGEWVFWTACRQLAEINAAGFGGVRMGVNISALQLRNGNLPILAQGAIEAYSLAPETLVFEITESVAMQQPEETVRILDQLSKMGVDLAIDDFGTGYSSLSYLRLFPVNHLKLDRSFTWEIGQGQGSSVICDATIGLAHNLGMKLVAEGVETEAQYDYLRQNGCDLVQDYLLSRPLTADALLDYLRRHNT